MKPRCAFNVFLLIIGCWCCILAMPAPALHAEPEEHGSLVETTDTDFSKLRALIESSLESEAKGMTLLQQRLAHVKNSFSTMTMELNAYEIQVNTYSDLLLFPNARLTDLEKALSVIEHSLVSIDKHRQTLGEEQSLVRQLESQTQEQATLHAQQRDVVREMPENPMTRKLLADSTRLSKLLDRKIELVREIDQWYEKGLARLDEIRQKLADFKPRFEQSVQEKKKELLFKREATPVYFIPVGQIGDELVRAWRQVRTTVMEDWAIVRKRIEEGGYLPMSVFFALFALLQWAMFRLRRYGRALDEKLRLSETHPLRCAALTFFTDSLPLLGAILFMFGYGKVRNIYFIVSLVRIAFYLLCVWLFTRWGMAAVRMWEQMAKTPPDRQIVRRLRFAVHLVRTLAVVGVLAYWTVKEHDFILFIYRAATGSILVGWSLSFWRAMTRKAQADGDKRLPPLQWHAMAFSHGVCATGLVLDLVGYGPFSLYWYLSWGLTLAFGIALTVLFLMLHEWRREYKSARPFPGQPKQRRNLQWLSLQISWILWAILAFDALLFAWFPDKSLYLDTVLQILGKPLPLPNLHISVMSLSLVTFILILTHAGSGAWQKVLPEKILGDSGMDTGLKNSITMITVYLIWFIGIMTALTILGFSSKSMAVAFGGLGIGLGFGLQAIFNNFISGIILLFERPIQVGDAVEINGVWGEIRKINVRSTHVQTYDNASLIIPNSEFISSQVTNWSFKDPRLRRHITVGVAYGSDIELVRKTLLEIAGETEHVLKYPAPSVLFTDFGDSALVFRLRIWTDVDNCLTAETDIRFEIDRRFRERSIEISFPQRDIHIRTVVPEFQTHRKPPSEKDPPPAPAIDLARASD